MDYSVYIIQDRNKTNQDLYENLASDVGIGDHLKNTAAAAGADLAGANILDRYATTDMLGQNGVAIDGEMIDSVSIKVELVKKNIFENSTNRYNPVISRTITVKGSLFAPSLIEMYSETVKNKDMSRVMAWASLAQKPGSRGPKYVIDSGDVDKTEDNGIQLNSGIQLDYISDDVYSKYYYRRVLVTTYSDTEKQFRAVLYDKVFVKSYEEVYDDKDGNGKFTLVMQTFVSSIYDVIVAGPTYKASIISVGSEISDTVQKYTKTTNKVVETVDKIAGTSIADDVENITGKIDSVAESADSLKADDSFTIEKVFEQEGKQADTFINQGQSAVDKAKEYTGVNDKLTDEQR